MFPSNLEAILFDAGGTLLRIDYAYIRETAAVRGHRLSERDLAHGEVAARRAVDARASVLHRADQTDASRVPGYFANILRAAGLPEASVESLRDDLIDHHRDSSLWRVPLDGVVETLRGIADRGVRTAVVSNSDGRVREKLVRAGLARYFEFVVDSHEEGVEKPDAEIFLRALGRMGVAAERSAYIGDIYSIDAVGARAAGMHPVLIDSTGAYEPGECRTINALAELLEGIDRSERT